MSIQWFPGHMTKSFRMMEESVKLVDIVIELLDARIPCSSKNPDIDRLIGGKRRILALNKADLADEALTQAWRAYYAQQGFQTVTLDSTAGKGFERLTEACENLMAEKMAAAKERGRIFKPIRAMIAGIPNVGKSTLINRYVGRSLAKTEDRPGVTRGRQWIRVKKGMDLLDTPGVLWPKFIDQETGVKLAITGAIQDAVLDAATLAARFVEMIFVIKPEAVKDRYHIEGGGDGMEILRQISLARGFLLKGGGADLEKSAAVLLDEFRGAKLGRITLEKPTENPNVGKR
ncbi:MAG: ribosome biogenesis GTPase YlqF [Clostridiales bacterium]|nr:ribosome biogenesis GTPase YlqF [Clostridiales bacterium]MDR3239327.1 ribosome biogenesis GTPase YlqF [Clostridiales bacterium]